MSLLTMIVRGMQMPLFVFIYYSSVYLQARALSAQCSNESEAIRFLVGTQSFRVVDDKASDNQVGNRHLS